MWKYLGAAVVCALALSTGSAVAASERAAAPFPVKFDASMGRALPTDNGKTEVALTCPGPTGSTCRGQLQLLPRGARTKALVGSAPVVNRPVAVAAGTMKIVSLPLSQRASSAVGAKQILTTTVLISSAGHRFSRVGVIGDKDFVKVTTRPQASHGAQHSAGGVETEQFNWSWHINAFLGQTPMPDFRCPSSKPNVESSGHDARARRDGAVGKTGKVWFTGDNVSTFDFDVAHTDGGGTDDKHLKGWPSSGNRVWVSGNLHFQLHVICTSGTSRDTAAWLNPAYGSKLLFPWQSY